MRFYIATSWKNRFIDQVIASIQYHKHTYYDFRHPASGQGFHWTDVDKDCANWTPYDYKQNLSHPLAEQQFKNDLEAMKSCDACILLLPCGRSAHTEAGWFAGQGKPVYAFIPTEKDFEPELMYKLFTKVCTNLRELNRQIYKDCCLMELDNPDWNWGTEEVADKEERKNLMKKEFSELLSDELIAHFMENHSTPQETATFLAKQYIIDMPDKRVITK